MNDNLVLLSGKTATGKSASLRNIKNPAGVMYLNCENNKKLPFKSGFKEYSITNPMDIYEAFVVAENKPEIHTIIIDSLTFMMDLYESKFVLTSANTMKAWGEYAQFFKRLMFDHVSVSTKNVIMTAHTLDVMNESEMISEVCVKVKGSLMANGIESYFSTVISSKKVPTKLLDLYGSPLLTVTEEEALLGFKYVYQTKLTKQTVNERIRAPMLMWSIPETYIDNDVQLVIDQLHDYYS